MKKIIFFLVFFLTTNSSAFEWGLQVTRKQNGNNFSEYYFINDSGSYAIRSPKDWTCMIKIDILRSIETEDSILVFQNAFLGCKTPDNMLATGASIKMYKGVNLIDETNLTLGLKNELELRLIPCAGSSKITCEEWKSIKTQEL